MYVLLLLLSGRLMNKHEESVSYFFSNLLNALALAEWLSVTTALTLKPLLHSVEILFDISSPIFIT